MVVLFRFKDKYKWAQVPWIQVGAKQYSTRLLLDIVTMKLPVSALIFLANLDIDFTVSFLGRCRMNAVDGDQVRVDRNSSKSVLSFPQMDSLITSRVATRISTGIRNTYVITVGCMEAYFLSKTLETAMLSVCFSFVENPRGNKLY